MAPSLAILLWLTWNSPKKPAMLLLCAVVGLLLWGVWGILERNFSWACLTLLGSLWAAMAEGPELKKAGECDTAPPMNPL